MWSFQYKHGDRPLEGFTIQRAAGRGGFGEVYYAVSDGGREVALKSITAYEQIELRGISQCMNLKSPQLVTIFDVKHNAEGRPWVIMEFVAGPSLRQLIDEHPSGLGEQKAAFFLREMGKGLTFLHDCGIVHRDLKPGNVFYENGGVKIGDYGLSKAITTSQHSGQTVTVGTVHYMAPEIGAGKYDRSIDIYALGAVLYEMLTGVPPFVGASPSEVLMKHLSAHPDCSNISEPYATAIKRAMAKDPAERFQSVQEMVEAVFGAQHVQQSMSVFSPEELSVVAARVAKQVAVGGGTADAGANPAAVTAQPPRPLLRDPWERFARQVEDVGGQVAQKFETLADNFANRMGGRPKTPPATSADRSKDMTVPVEDPLPVRSRRTLAVIVSGVAAIAAGVLMQPRYLAPPLVSIFVFVAIWGQSLGVLLYRRSFQKGLEQESRIFQRLMLVVTVAVTTLVAAGPAWIFMLGHASGYPMGLRESGSFGTWLAMFAPFLLIEFVTRWLRSDRSDRVSLPRVAALGGIGFGMAMVFNGSPHIVVAVLAGTGLALQVLSPWQPRPQVRPGSPQPQAQPGAGAQSDQPGTPGSPQAAGALNPMRTSPPPLPVFGGVPVPPAVRFIWLGVFALSISLAVAFFVAANFGRSRDFAPFVSAGVGGCIVALMCLVRGFTGSYYGLWNYLLRPVLISTCLVVAVVCSIILGNESLRGDEVALATFWIVFPSIIVLALLFIPGKRYRRILPSPGTGGTPAGVAGPAVSFPAIDYASPYVSPFKRLWALVLSLLIFAGVCGLQRFYVGKIGTGILWLLTGGLFGIGQLVDGIMILAGSFTDKHGRRLVIWEDWNELENRTGQQTIAPRTQPWSDLRQPAPATMSAYAAVRGHAMGLLSALAGLLLFIGTVLGIGLVINLPYAASVGAFGQPVANELLRSFDGYAAWPALVYKLAFVLVSIVFLIGIVVMIFARRRAGFWHIMCGVMGAGALLIVLAILLEACGTLPWESIAPLVNANQGAAAVDLFLNDWEKETVIMAGVMFVLANVLMAWPPRKPQVAMMSSALAPAAPAIAEGPGES